MLPPPLAPSIQPIAQAAGPVFEFPEAADSEQVSSRWRRHEKGASGPQKSTVIVLRIGKKMSGIVHVIAQRKAVRIAWMYGSPGAAVAYEFHRSPSTFAPKVR